MAWKHRFAEIGIPMQYWISKLSKNCILSKITLTLENGDLEFWIYWASISNSAALKPHRVGGTDICKSS